MEGGETNIDDIPTVCFLCAFVHIVFRGTCSDGGYIGIYSPQNQSTLKKSVVVLLL